jgi:hypothetical protein
MPSTYSSSLKIELMATGENANTWGTITNTNLGTALEQAIVGYGNPSFASDANLTITLTDTNAAQAARALVLNVTSAVSLTATRELVVPTIQKQYIVQNNTTGSQSITVKTSAGTGITVPSGRKAHLYVNGTDVIQMFDFVDINGGAIDGTAIGASSASTGAFTTLAASGTLSTSNGTVGTPSINNSSDTNTGIYFPAADTLGLVTAGAERARVDATGLIGLGTSTPGSYGGRLNVYAGDVVLADSGTSSGASAPRLGSSAQALVFKTDTGSGSAAEVARFDGAGNLGIGANSPAAKVDIRNTTGMRLNVTSAGSILQFNKDATPTIASAVGNAIPGGSVTDDMVFSAWNGSSWAEQARLDAAGNFAIGRTASSRLSVQDTLAVIGNSNSYIVGGGTSSSPRVIRMDSSGFSFSLGTSFSSATGGILTTLGVIGTKGMSYGGSSGASWAGNTSFLQGNYNEAVWGISNSSYLSNNVYFSSGFLRYIDAGVASLYGQESGAHLWSNAVSGSAGGPITMTRRMTLDTSGNLGIGTTSPAAKLEVVATSSPEIRLQNNTVSSVGQFGFYSGSTLDGKISFQPNIGTLDISSGRSAGWGGEITFTVDTSERMRLDSSGNLGIGTSSPAARLHVNGTGSATNAIAYVTSDVGPYLGLGVADSSYSWIQGFNSLPLYINHQGNNTIINGTTGNVGIGTTSPSQRLAVRSIDNSGATVIGRFESNNAAQAVQVRFASVLGDGGNTTFGTSTNNATIFAVNNTEVARLDTSGNLGIGEAPNAWGANPKSISLKLGAFISGGGARWQMNAGVNAYESADDVWRYSAALPATRYSQADGAHYWLTAPSGTVGNTISFTQAMVLTAAGNLGIGTTSPAANLDVRLSGTAQFVRVQGAASGSSNLVLQSDGGSGSAWWLTAKTAGYLAIGGNGGSEPATGALNIDGTGRVMVKATTASGDGITVGAGGQVFVRSSDESTVATLSADTGGASYLASYRATGGTLVFITANTSGNNTERARIDSAGNVGIGTSSPSYRLSIYDSTGTGLGFSNPASGNFNIGLLAGSASLDAYVFQRANAPLIIGTNNTERARITSGGDLLVGTTSTSSTSGSGLKILPEGNGATAPQAAIVTSASTNSTSSLALYSTGAAAYRFYVADGGTIYATSTTISAISDQRLKENIRDLDDGLSAVMALKPRKFDWKAGKGKDVKDDRGFIAQEFEQVFPDLIDEWKDPAPEGEAPYKAVNANLIPTLVKAIQEQQAIINDLRARVAALESN